MRRTSLIALALLAGCSRPAAQQQAVPSASSSASAAAAPAPPPKAPESFDVKAIDEYVEAKVKERGFPGLSLAIMRDGKIVLAKGYGRRDLEAARSVTPDTQFAIASITKQFTCASALLLQEKGKLKLQDKVAKYYPNLTRASDITLDDLLSHTSGYPDYYPLDFSYPRVTVPIEPDKLLEQFAGGKLDFEPRSQWSYSNTGFVLAGRIIEKTAGVPLGEFMQANLLKPAGLQHTSFQPPATDATLAKGYTSFELGDPEPTKREGEGWMHGAGALYSTPTDLATWDLALMQGKVVSPASFQTMTAPRQLTNGGTTDYGCGLAIQRKQRETVYEHGGEASGFLSYNSVVPRTRSAVITMVNTDAVDPKPLHDELLALVLKAQANVPKVQGPGPKEAALDTFHQLQAGVVDRSKLGEDFSGYATEARLKAAAPRLQALGEPTSVEILRIRERGGMEVTTLHMHFASRSVEALMYRTPDGKIQEFLLYKL